MNKIRHIRKFKKINLQISLSNCTKCENVFSGVLLKCANCKMAAEIGEGLLIESFPATKCLDAVFAIYTINICSKHSRKGQPISNH